MSWLFVFGLIFVAWLVFIALVGLDAAEGKGRFEAIGHEGTRGRVFLGFWPKPIWGIDFAVRVTYWPNRGMWNRVSLGPMFRRRFMHRRFEFYPRCRLTGIKTPGWDMDMCCPVCELGRSWVRGRR